MADLAVINIEVVFDNSPMDKMIKSTAAAEAMVRRLNQAYKDGKITMDDALRGLQEIEVYEKRNSVAVQDSIRLQKEFARVAKENSVMLLQQAREEQAEKDKWFASQRRKLDMMKESQRIEDKRISDEIKATEIAAKQQLKEADAIKIKSEIAKAAADAEIASYVQTTLAAEKAAAAKAAAFQRGIGGTLGLGSTNASANGGGTGQAFIAQALKEEAAERERLAIAEKREADQLEYLNMKYDRGYAAAKLYKSVQDEINLAMSRGVGNADQLQAQLNKLEMEYASFGAGTTDVTNRFNQQAAAVEQSRKGVNKFGLLVQQTGYQAGDFLVQIQSGTNAFVAFGQQATQLVGILPMFATELGISALALGGITLGLSIAIPLLTAIGAYFSRTSKDAKDAAEGVTSYSDSIKNLSNELASLKTRVSEAKFGVDSAAEADALQKIADLNLQMFNKRQEYIKTDSLGTRQRLAEDIFALQKQAGGLQVIVDKVEEQREALRKVNTQIAENTHQYEVYYNSLKKSADEQVATDEKRKQSLINAYKYMGDTMRLSAEQVSNEKEQSDALTQRYMMEITIAKFGKDSAEVKKLELQQALDDYNKQIDAQVKSKELSADYGELLKQANETGQQGVVNAEAIAKAEEKKTQALISSYEHLAKSRTLYAEQLAAYDKENSAIDDRLTMEITIAKFGKDSAEVKAMQRERELDLYDQGIDKAILLGKYTKDQGESLKDSNRIRQDAVDLQQKETDALNNGSKLVRDYLNTYLNLGKVIKDASKVDLKEVFQKAISPSNSLYQFVTKTYDMMLNMANMSIRPKLSFDTSSYSEPKPSFGFGSMGGDQVYTAGVGFESTTGTGKDKTKTGGTDRAAKKDPLLELQKQIALQEELNGKTEAEIKVRQALGEDFSKYSPMVIKGLEDQIQKQIELEDRLKEQQGIFDTVKSSMEDAFMGMVDGTKSAKDAFKSMAAAIIKELYNVLVVQRLVGSFNASTGVGSGIVGAIAGAFGGGGAVSHASIAGFANGGDIRAGVPIMVGERGPEMIIPKSSGTVLTNGQTKAALGGVSNDNYVVHNNISVTGSDSAMVRQEIAKMIPQISSATKAAMIDAKKRGGQMGAAFR